MKKRNSSVDVFLGWTDETGVVADIDESSSGFEHAPYFAYGSGEVVEVGMREHRDRRVERLVLERQGAGVAAHELGLRGVCPRDAELISGDVDADRGPSEREQCPQKSPSPATDVEAATSARAE
jgi:hypothetical protein